MEYSNDSELYYRRLCQELGAQLQQSNDRQRATLREVRRAKLVSALTKQLFRLKSARYSTAQIAERMTSAFCTHLSLECCALYAKGAQQGGFKTLAYVGFAIDESCDLSRKASMPEFVYVDSEKNNLGISRVLENISHTERTVWCFNHASGLALLLGNSKDEQSSSWPLSRGDREVLHSILELIANVINEAETRHHGSRQLIDELTGLANRRMIIDYLERESRERATAHSTAVLYLDIDGFKHINQQYNHLMGDKVLLAVAQRVKEILRPGDMFGRVGVDEFVILAPGQRIESDSILIAERILSSFRKPIRIGGHSFYISWSIGISETSSQQAALETIRDANLAMFNAKSNGGAKCICFGQEMRHPSSENLRLESDMQLALERQELSLYYQPIFSTRTNVVVAFEALLRWHHPRLGILKPKDFMAQAAQSEIAKEIGDWVIGRVVRDLNIWASEGDLGKSVSVCINIDEAQLIQEDFVKKLGANLRLGRIDPQRIRLEISEKTLERCRAIQKHVLQHLSSMGVKIVLDDFGSGASSLSQLHSLPIDTVKIDRYFIEKMASGGTTDTLVKAMIDLAKNLDMQIIATGAEHSSQLAKLKVLECDFVQGYLLGRPLAALKVGRFMDNQEIAAKR